MLTYLETNNEQPNEVVDTTTKKLQDGPLENDESNDNKETQKIEGKYILKIITYT